MNLQGLVDLHTHSSFSPDAESLAEEMCARAEELNLFAYGISDHCDVNFWEEISDKNITDFSMYGSGEYSLKSIEKVSALKEKYPFLLCGIELGQPLQNKEKAEKIASDSRLDYIIGSQHMNKGLDDFYWLDYDKMDGSQIDKILKDYFVQLLEMCRWGKFDILGHLTYPLRYICVKGRNVDLKDYEDIIREIFRTVIENGKGIEINCSGLRQEYGKTFPDAEMVKLYKNLGGEIITLGSDAHNCKDLGKGIKAGAEIARNAGFKYIACFRNHQAEFVKIPT